MATVAVEDDDDDDDGDGEETNRSHIGVVIKVVESFDEALVVVSSSPSSPSSIASGAGAVAFLFD